MAGRQVTATALGEHLGMSRQAVSALEKAGVLRMGKSGLFDEDESRLAYITHLRDGRRDTPRSEADTRAREARARQIELKVAREEGRLIDVEDMEQGFAAAISQFRSELGGVPAAASRDTTIRRAIDRAINDAVARLRDHFAALGQSLRSGGRGDVDGQAPGARRVGRR